MKLLLFSMFTFTVRDVPFPQDVEHVETPMHSHSADDSSNMAVKSAREAQTTCASCKISPLWAYG